MTDSRNLAVGGAVSAPSGTVGLTAQSGRNTPSVAEGQDTGNLTVTGSVAGGVGVTLQAAGGLSATQVATPGTATLLAGADVGVSGLNAGVVTGNAGGGFQASGTFASAVSIGAVGGGLSLTDSGALSLQGTSRSQGNAVVAAPVIGSSGVLASGQTVSLTAANGAFTQTGGTIAAAGNLVVASTGAVNQQGGVLAAGSTVRLTAGGDAVEANAGIVAAPTVQVVAGGDNSFGASHSAAVSLAAAAVDRSGVLPVFSGLSAPVVTLQGRPGSVVLDGNTVTLGLAVAGDTVALHGAGNVAEAVGGTIQAGTLQVTAGYAANGADASGLPLFSALGATNAGTGAATLASAGNSVLRLGDSQVRNGLQFTDAPTAGAGLTIAGIVHAGLATDPLTAGAASAGGAPIAITLLGPAAALSIGDAAAPNAALAGSTVTLTVPGTISQASGALIAAGTLAGSAGSAGLTPLAGNQIAGLGPFATTGDFSLQNATGLQVTGAVIAGPATPSGTSPTLTIATGGPLDLAGGGLTAGTVTLTIGGALTESAGAITANTLNLSASQVTGGGRNSIGTIASITSPGGISLSNGGDLTVTGPLTASAGPVTLNAGGALTTTGAVNSSGAVVLTSVGPLTQGGAGSINAASVSATTQGAANLAGSIVASGPVSVTASGLNTTGTVSSQSGAVSLDAGQGALTQSGLVQGGTTVAERGGQGTTLAGKTVAGTDLTVASSGGVITASTSSMQAGNGLSVIAAGPGTLAGMTTAFGPVSVTASGLTVSGPVTSQAGPVTLNAGGFALTQSGTVSAAGALSETAGTTASLSGVQSAGGPLSVMANGITIGGMMQSSSGSVALDAGTGSLMQSGQLGAATGLTTKSGGATSLAGKLNAGTIDAQSGGDVALASGSSAVAGQTVTVKAAGTASFAGTLSAPEITVTAPSVSLQGGTIMVGGTTQPPGVKSGGVPALATAKAGAFFEVGTQFSETAATTVQALGSANSTVRIDFTGTGGTFSVNSFSAPETNLVVNLGTASGTGSGLQVNNFSVLYAAQGAGAASLNLTGVRVGTQAGTGAAEASSASPSPNRNYQINGCAIASINCVVLQPQAVPVTNPLKSLALTFFDNQDDERDVLVPNVSDQGL